MSNNAPLNDAELGQLLGAAKSQTPLVSEDLMTRIMADAASQTVPMAVPMQPKQGFVVRLLDAIGGWPVVAGLTTATVAGLAIGLSAPDQIDDLTNAFLSAETSYDIENLVPSFGDILGEG